MVYLIVAVVKICSMIDFFALRFGGEGTWVVMWNVFKAAERLLSVIFAVTPIRV